MKQWLILWDFMVLTFFLLVAGMQVEHFEGNAHVQLFFILLTASAIQALVMTIRTIK